MDYTVKNVQVEANEPTDSKAMLVYADVFAKYKNEEGKENA